MSPTSDLDFTVVVLEQATDLIPIADAQASLACMRNSDVDGFRLRAEAFIADLDDKMTVFSHKVQL